NVDVDLSCLLRKGLTLTNDNNLVTSDMIDITKCSLKIAVRRMYYHYIDSNSRMQINLSYSDRTYIQDFVKKYLEEDSKVDLHLPCKGLWNFNRIKFFVDTEFELARITRYKCVPTELIQIITSFIQDFGLEVVPIIECAYIQILSLMNDSFYQTNKTALAYNSIYLLIFIFSAFFFVNPCFEIIYFWKKNVLDEFAFVFLLYFELNSFVAFNFRSTRYQQKKYCRILTSVSNNTLNLPTIILLSDFLVISCLCFGLNKKGLNMKDKKIKKMELNSFQNPFIQYNFFSK
ncbi:hypothetical protein RFI_00180, partial [Reticulomyxa filosa]